MSEPNDHDQSPRTFPTISAGFRMGGRPKPLADGGKADEAVRANRKFPTKLRLAVGGAAAAFVGAVALAIFQQQVGGLPLFTDWLASRAEEMPHSYSFPDGNRLIRGESTSKFVSRDEYSARLESCMQITTDAAKAVITVCYITLRPNMPLVVTNVMNLTRAVFGDGSRASVCCISVNNTGTRPTSQFSAGFIGPAGTYQRSFEAGEEVQIIVQIPSLQSDLDVIYFSPGNQPTTVILPAAKYTERRHMTKAMVARLGDAQLREFIVGQQNFEAEIRKNQQRHAEVFGRSIR